MIFPTKLFISIFFIPAHGTSILPVSQFKKSESYALCAYQFYFQHKSRIWLVSRSPATATITVIFHEAYCHSPLTGFPLSAPVLTQLCLTLPPHGLQHTHPGACSNSCPSSRWCHPTISYSVSSSPPTFNLSQHQGLFQWVSSLYQVTKVLEFQLQHQSFQWIFRTDFL